MMLNRVYAPACTSSNGFGQIRHKTKRGFLLTYTPIKAFMQASYDAKLSLKDTFMRSFFQGLKIVGYGYYSLRL